MLKRRTAFLGALTILPVMFVAGSHAAERRVRKAAPSPAAPPPAAENAAPKASPANTPLGPLDILAKWAVIIDYNSGATLLDKDADVPMAPSSMTKLMTIYLVYTALKAGRLQLDQELPVSERAWRTGGSKMFVPYPGRVKVEDLIRGVVVDSGNDACVVLAEGIAGSEENFVEMMNQKAHELGLAHTNFRNSTGLPDANHYMSARDIALLGMALIRNFPEYYHYDSERDFRFNNIEQYNRNPLVQKGLADGLKTGHTEAGGYGLVASADRAGRRIILVLNGLATMRERAQESERLLEWAFQEFEDVTLFTAADVIDRVPVWLGTERSVPLVGGRDLVVTMPRQWQRKAKVTVAFNAPVSAPVAKGTQLGKLVVSGDGVPALEAPLFAGADVPRLGVTGRAWAVLTHYITGS
ncbi:MAG: D-alanyl-D-alanine carboxypeptidase [Acidobacteriia bacterium]|nr:D-alanyl-D-alanine carboxypeptidase [Methyloceanibacter sp.]MBX5471926.1 D-alanyl-D-alanine carboxypeptidase [Acetobacteraceae bacterium]MCL6491557.1 D-alanyl-D-alanine carboxypeptidase [Terriglobia bacterium]